MRYKLVQYRPESHIGVQTVFQDMTADTVNKNSLRQWLAPSITLSRNQIHEFAKVGKDELIEWLYHEIKVAEWANLRRLRMLKRQAALESLRYVRKDPIEGYVYWIQDTDKNLIKIGCSNNPERRLRELRNEYGAQLDIIDTIESNHMYLHEHMAHQLYASRRVHGEWFNLQPCHTKIWNYAVKKNWLKDFV